MQVISVIGASGFIGHHLLKFLAERDGLEIRVLVHRELPELIEGCNMRFIKGSLLKPETLDAPRARVFSFKFGLSGVVF